MEEEEEEDEEDSEEEESATSSTAEACPSTSFTWFHLGGRRYSRSFNGIVTARRPNSYQFSVCSHLSSRWVLLSCLSKSLLSIKSFSIGRARGRERERESS